MACIFGDADCLRDFKCAPLTLSRGPRIWPRSSKYVTLIKNLAPKEEQFPFPGYSDFVPLLSMLGRYAEKNSYVINFIRNIVSRILSRKGLAHKDPAREATMVQDILRRLNNRGLFTIDKDLEDFKTEVLDFSGFNTLGEDFKRTLLAETGFDEYRLFGIGQPGPQFAYQTKVRAIQDVIRAFLVDNFYLKDDQIAFGDVFISPMDRARIAQMASQAAAMKIEAPADISKVEFNFEVYKYFIALEFDDGSHLTLVYGHNLSYKAIEQLKDHDWSHLFKEHTGSLSLFNSGNYPVVYLFRNIEMSWWDIVKDDAGISEYSTIEKFTPHSTVEYCGDLDKAIGVMESLPRNRTFVPTAVKCYINGSVEWEVLFERRPR